MVKRFCFVKSVIIATVFSSCSLLDTKEVSYSEWNPRYNNLLFEVLETKTKWNNKIQKSWEGKAYIAQIVTPYNETNFITKWRFLYPDTSSIEPITNINNLNGLGSDIPGYKSALNVEYSTVNGRLDEIKNWSEISTYYDTVISIFKNEMMEDSLINTQGWESFERTFGNRDFITNSITKHINAYHRFYDLSYSMDTTSWVAPLQGLNGEPIMGEISTVIIEESEEVLGVLIAVEYQNEEIAENLIGFIQELQPDSLVSNFNFEWSVKDTCITYYSKIWECPLSVEYWRDMEMDSLYNRYHLKMTQKSEEELINWKP